MTLETKDAETEKEGFHPRLTDWLFSFNQTFAQPRDALSLSESSQQELSSKRRGSRKDKIFNSSSPEEGLGAPGI